MRLRHWGFIFLIFIITVANSDAKLFYWFFKSGSGPISFPYYDFLGVIGFTALLLVLKYIQKREEPELEPEGPGIIMAFALWFAGATVSLTRNIQMSEALTNYFSGTVCPMIIFLTLRGIHLDERKINRIFLAVSIGLLTPLILGILAYLREWGIPSLYTLAYSRYNLTRMESYMQVTFGNVSHMAQLILLVGPPLLVLALDRTRPLRLRIWFFFCLFLIGINLLIVQSLTSFFVMAGACLLLIIFRKYFKSLVLIVIGLVVMGFVFHNLFDRIISLVMGRQGSLMERLDAIQDGWNLFQGNWLFGVGPGLSYLYIYANTTHQFFLQQGVELGILGLISSVLLVAVVFSRMLRVMLAGSGNPAVVTKFILLIGPFSFLLYGVITNIPINIEIVNIWVNLLAAFLALSDFRAAPDPAALVFNGSYPVIPGETDGQVRKVL